MGMDSLILLSLLALFLPLAGFIVLIFTGKYLPRQGDWVATGAVAISFVLALAILFGKLATPESITAGWAWVQLGNIPVTGGLTIELGVLIDNLGAIMLVVVTLISLLVHVFSMG